MGAQLSKGGVAVEGKAVADPAVAKTNGQVREVQLHASTFGTQRPRPA